MRPRIKLIFLLMLIASPAYAGLFFWHEKAEDRKGWYLGMETILYSPYDMAVLWSHGDWPLECDQFVSNPMPYDPLKCRDQRVAYSDHPIHVQSDILFPGIHLGRAWKNTRLELEYYFREHNSYNNLPHFSRAGSFVEEIDPEEYYNFHRSKEFRTGYERLTEVWGQFFFLNAYYDFRGLLGPIVPYVGLGGGFVYQHIYYLTYLQRTFDLEALAELGLNPEWAGTITQVEGNRYDENWAWQRTIGIDAEIRDRTYLGIKISRINIRGYLKTSGLFELLRGHGSNYFPYSPDSEEYYWTFPPVRWELWLSDMEGGWKFALNLKYLF